MQKVKHVFQFESKNVFDTSPMLIIITNLFRKSVKNIIVTALLLVPLLSKSQQHQYFFNNNLNELTGGPPLSELLACGSTPGTYSVQTIITTQGDCFLSSSICFGKGGGFQYPNSNFITGSYTINVFFRFTTLSTGYARVIDFSNSTSDGGIYFYGNCLNFYPNGNVGPCPYFNTNTYYLMTFVRDGATNLISVYVDGTLFTSYTDSGNIYRPATATTPLIFFKDDPVGPACENQPGCVKYISVSPVVSTAADVSAMYANIAALTASTTLPKTIVTIAPTLNFNCLINSVTLSASSVGNIVWNGGSLSNSGNPVNVIVPATYLATATDTNGCFDTAMVTVTTNTTPPTVTASSSGNFTCSDSIITLTGNSLGNTLIWNGGTLVNAPNPSSVTVPGTYTVKATDVVNGCTNTASVTVYDSIHPIDITVNSPVICVGQTATLTATGGSIYSWTTGATSSGVNTATATPAITTTYTVTGKTGVCTDTAVATVTANPLPMVTVNSLTICNGVTANLIATGATAYSWSPGANSTGIATANAKPSTTTTYTVTGTSLGCSSTALSTVTVNARPHAAFKPNPNPADVLDPFIIMYNQSSSDVNYCHWNFGDGDTLVALTGSSPAHTYPNTSAGLYLATLIVHNAFGCNDTISHEIVVSSEFAFFIPNAFSPNGDGFNDYFFGSGVRVADYDFRIFNRWGTMVFHGTDVNDKWDGRAKGGSDIAEPDVYVWKIKIKDVFGGLHNYTGTVTVVK